MSDRAFERGFQDGYANAQEELGHIDTRWRPVETAPDDGIVVEGLWQGGEILLVEWAGDEWWTVGPPDECAAMSTPIAWRPAHPDWNSEAARILRAGGE